MTPSQAFNTLKSQGQKKIKTIVDRGENLEAIMVLMPNFEYPDWDYRTVAAFLRSTCAKLIAQGKRENARARDQIMRDCGLVKVRGAMSGKIYWE